MKLPKNLDFQTDTLLRDELLEMKVSSIYSTLKTVLWHSDDVLYIALPSYGVSCSLAYPSDIFWNQETLTRHLDNHVDARIVALAINQEIDLILSLSPR